MYLDPGSDMPLCHSNYPRRSSLTGSWAENNIFFNNLTYFFSLIHCSFSLHEVVAKHCGPTCVHAKSEIDEIHKAAIETNWAIKISQRGRLVHFLFFYGLIHRASWQGEGVEMTDRETANEFVYSWRKKYWGKMDQLSDSQINMQYTFTCFNVFLTFDMCTVYSARTTI